MATALLAQRESGPMADEADSSIAEKIGRITRRFADLPAADRGTLQTVFHMLLTLIHLPKQHHPHVLEIMQGFSAIPREYQTLLVQLVGDEARGSASPAQPGPSGAPRPQGQAGLRERSPDSVLKDHLRLWKLGDVESDIARNYSPAAVIVRGDRTYRGHDEIRTAATDLGQDLPDGRFEYRAIRVEQDMAFLEWSAANQDAIIDHGVDSFLIRDGWILIQTVHYTVGPRKRPA
jgi:hypothetical protein